MIAILKVGEGNRWDRIESIDFSRCCDKSSRVERLIMLVDCIALQFEMSYVADVTLYVV
jgi:hypothetical protein